MRKVNNNVFILYFIFCPRVYYKRTSLVMQITLIKLCSPNRVRSRPTSAGRCRSGRRPAVEGQSGSNVRRLCSGFHRAQEAEERGEEERRGEGRRGGSSSDDTPNWMKQASTDLLVSCTPSWLTTSLNKHSCSSIHSLFYPQTSTMDKNRSMQLTPWLPEKPTVEHTIISYKQYCAVIAQQ